MTNYLFRANNNDSGIYLCKVYGSENKIISIKKSANTQSAIIRLKREMKGLIWYSDYTGIEHLISCVDLENYFSLNIKFIKGDKADYRNGYWVNRDFIDKALVRYCEIWSNSVNPKIYSHGDFSLDNMIFTNEVPVFIDWEHFSNSILPIGFDALNLIYEQLYIYIKKNKLNENVINKVNHQLKTLYSYDCLNECFFKTPLIKLIELIETNKNIWGNQISKLPVMKITKAQVKEFDQKVYLN